MAPAPAPAAAPAFYKQPSLPYAFTSLEPYIDARTVQVGLPSPWYVFMCHGATSISRSTCVILA